MELKLVTYVVMHIFFKNLPDWSVFNDSQLLILQENRSPTLDKITEFSIRSPELCQCFDQVGDFFAGS